MNQKYSTLSCPYCRENATRDTSLSLEEEEKQYDNISWTCLSCGKSFYTERIDNEV